MKYLLDTNICIAWLNGEDLTLRDKLLSTDQDDICLCSVVKGELYYGAQKSEARLKNEKRLEVFFSQMTSLPYNDEAALHYGALRAMLEKSGMRIGENDMKIAAIAELNRLTVVTRNRSEFQRIPSIKVEVW